MQIQHKQKDTHGLFFIEEDGDIVAEMSYSLTGNGSMIIEHTEVSEELQGQNLGYELVQSSVEYARKHRHTISPVCQFAKAVFDKKPDFRDVLE